MKTIEEVLCNQKVIKMKESTKELLKYTEDYNWTTTQHM